MATAPRRNRIVVATLVGVVVGMVGLAYASVPLYRIFCQVTGYGGATQRAELAPEPVPGKSVTVRFNADVNSAMPWSFQPLQREITLDLGESGLAVYRVQNLSNERIVGTATFNVTPFVAGPYFDKIQCFCFEEQVLEPGASADLPVTFFVDPAILDDPETADIRTVTLSYTFFRVADPAPLAKVSSAADAAAAGGSLN